MSYYSSSKLPKTTTVANSSSTSSVTTSFSLGYTRQNLNINQPPMNSNDITKQELSPQKDQVMSVLDEIDIPGILPADIADLESEDIELFLQN